MARVVWQIVRSKGDAGSARVEGMRVTYGKVPDGYARTVPGGSEHPEPLPLGVVCSFFAETINAPGAGGAIFVSSTGPVQIDVRDQCLRRIDGREVQVNCQTGAPYQEPTDIEKYVEEHRIVR